MFMLLAVYVGLYLDPCTLVTKIGMTEDMDAIPTSRNAILMNVSDSFWAFTDKFNLRHITLEVFSPILVMSLALTDASASMHVIHASSRPEVVTGG